MKRLICMMGLPYSGKTTAARKYGFPMVCPDAIRKAFHGKRYSAGAEPFVWPIAKVMVRSLFLAGHDAVVLDACNGTRSRRSVWFDREWETHWHQLLPIGHFQLGGSMKVDVAKCVDRAKAAKDLDIIPVIERMAAAWEPRTTSEQKQAEESARA